MFSLTKLAFSSLVSLTGAGIAVINQSFGHDLEPVAKASIFLRVHPALVALTLLATGAGIADTQPASSDVPERSCEPNFDIRFTQERLCLIGFPEHRRAGLYKSATRGRREVQWQAREVLSREDFLSDAWPIGVSAVRISDGEIAPPRKPLRKSSFPNMLQVQTGGRSTFFPQNLSLASGGLRIRCYPTLLPAARGRYVEDCNFVPSMGGLRIIVYAYTGFFWDGSPGWPLFFTDYDEDAWQASLNQVEQFLDHAILFREPN